MPVKMLIDNDPAGGLVRKPCKPTLPNRLFPRFKGLNKGYIQVYTGDGKGKSTAAFGLTLRAIGNGARVFIGQFLKNGDYGEIKALRIFAESVLVEQYGTGEFVDEQMTSADDRACRNGIKSIKKILISGRYDLVILDEINIAVCCGLLSMEELMGIISLKPDNMELVFTGRYALPEVVAIADLVTEMKEVKHYYHDGVIARVGIEK